MKNNIWVETDIMGHHHVMIKSPIDGESICYCTLYYHPLITDNSRIREASGELAIKIGAQHPVTYVTREWDLCHAK